MHYFIHADKFTTDSSTDYGKEPQPLEGCLIYDVAPPGFGLLRLANLNALCDKQAFFPSCLKISQALKLQGNDALMCNFLLNLHVVSQTFNAISNSVKWVNVGLKPTTLLLALCFAIF